MKTKIILIIYKLLTFGFFITFFFSCSKESGSPDPTNNVTLPIVKTNDVFNIVWTAAEITGTIVSTGGGTITQNGFCWGTSENPTLANNFNLDQVQSGDFHHNMQNLLEGTSYYARAYATNSAGTSYGESKSFSTGMSCQTMVQRHPGYQVWAGDTPYFQETNHYEYFYSIDKFNYTLIGSSTTTQNFNTGNYKYYVIVANYFSCFDAVQFNDGSYLSNNTVTLFGGLSETDKMLGLPDGIAGKLGDKNLCPPNGTSTYNGYITDSGTISSRGGGLKVFVVDGCQ